MKKKMKAKNVYVVRTRYGETEEVRWKEDGWVGRDTGRKYDESEFISYTKIKGTEKEKGE